MGNESSNLIDELHTTGPLPDVNLSRKLTSLRAVRTAAASSRADSTQIVQQGGLVPLGHDFLSTHPLVRLEAARTLCALSRNPANRTELSMEAFVTQAC